MNRRGFLRGAGALLAAPAIVRASSLMPVRVLAADVNEIAFTTDNLIVKCYERFQVGAWHGWANAYGSLPMQWPELFLDRDLSLKSVL